MGFDSAAVFWLEGANWVVLALIGSHSQSASGLGLSHHSFQVVLGFLPLTGLQYIDILLISLVHCMFGQHAAFLS